MNDAETALDHLSLLIDMSPAGLGTTIPRGREATEGIEEIGTTGVVASPLLLRTLTAMFPDNRNRLHHNP